ncbi:hypothetical protein [Rhizobium leguminosarum]|uniref:hypothetical protein n=1 Tax=Rhizobium leguminosarum TaxID=384 RepID=UPI0021BBB776|nr:hypothetical protein [Rhizobium leguminosarum]
MSSIHANMDICGRTPAFDRNIVDAVSSRLTAASGAAKSLLLAFRYRLATRRIQRFSDHRLHDIGFERDWDGSVITRQK